MRLFDRLDSLRSLGVPVLWMTLALALPNVVWAAEGTVAAADDAPAATPSPAPPPPIEVTGFVDTYYSYNGNKPTGDTLYRNFDTKHEQAAVSLIELAFEQKPATGHAVGFRVDLDFGPTTDIVHASEPGGAEVYKNFEQAYVSYLAPLGKGLQFDAGKFVTPAGAEVIEAKDNWNYSRSLLFALAIPYYHTGLRATYAPSDKVSFAGYLVNGWNNTVENNDGKTLGASLTLKPSAAFSVVENVLWGPEQKDDTKDKRFLSDTVITVTAQKLSLMANYDYGQDTVAGSTVTWQGIAAYAKLQVSDVWAVTPRFEFYKDQDGFTTGVVQNIKEFTITSEQKLGGALITRLEFRRDFSDKAVFTKDGKGVKDQNTFTFGLVYAFAGKL
jgi:hypothetical protein